jgi:hypothetical protein
MGFYLPKISLLKWCCGKEHSHAQNLHFLPTTGFFLMNGHSKTGCAVLCFGGIFNGKVLNRTVSTLDFNIRVI